MIKSINELEHRPIEIDLTGPEGNAWVLMGKARILAKQLGMNPSDITAEMQMSDFENLVNVFEKHFGHLVTLYR